MKHNLRYRFIVVPGKITGEVRVTVDERQVEYTSSNDNGKSTSLNLFPFISLSITRPSERDETGKMVRAPWNVNDTLAMTKFNMPIFIRELESISSDLKIPDMYIYTGSRLDLNDTAAEKARRVFMIANTTLEFTPVVIEQPDDTRVEGIKVKFNNEQSSFTLTINEIDSILYNLKHLEVDSIAMSLYNSICKRSSSADIPVVNNRPYVDIQPKAFED